MTNSQTPHSRRKRAETAAARVARLKAEGWRSVTILLPPDTAAALDREAVRHGSRAAALTTILTDR